LSQKRWKRIIILASGSFANLIAAFIIVLIITAGADSFGGTTITNVVDRFPEQGPSEIMVGDRFVAMNGERLFYYDDFAMFSQLNAGKPLTVTIERNGELIEYVRRTYLIDGVEEFRYSLSFDRINANFWEIIKYSGYQTYSFVRMIRLSIAMMVSGAIGIGDFAGPVGIIDTMNTIGHQVQENESTFAAISSIVFFTAFIGVNVAVINLLPIPAMDGGRIFFTVLTWIIEKITRKRLDPKYEGYINTTVFVLLIGFMIFILYNDVARIITR
jgi:regulator of sigma E protease